MSHLADQPTEILQVQDDMPQPQSAPQPGVRQPVASTTAAGRMDPMVIANLMRRRRDPLETLTPREREVLGLMAQGLSNASIAEQLTVTLGGVEKHTQRIFAKLGLLPDDSAHRRVLAVLQFLR